MPTAFFAPFVKDALGEFPAQGIRTGIIPGEKISSAKAA